MRRLLSRNSCGIYHYDASGFLVYGAHSGIRGDTTWITGDTTQIMGDVNGISGNVTGIRGDVSGISGNVTGIIGDLNDCGITQKNRYTGVDISDLVKDN